MTEFKVTLNMVKDKRVPRRLRKQAYRLSDGTSGTLGAAGIPESAGEVPAVYVDVAAIKGCAQEMRAGFISVLLRTSDHEYAHIGYNAATSSKEEERMAMRFEKAGAWARVR